MLKYLSGRCSPFSRISRIRFRYWCSSCGGDCLAVIASLDLRGMFITGTGSGSKIEGAMFEVLRISSLLIVKVA